MKNALKQLNEKPIAYYPIYRKITGSTTGGILLSQLMYWLSKKDKIFKTDAEIMEETFLTKKELENSKKLIKQLDFITVSREGLPAKTFYEIDWEKMLLSFHQWGKLATPKGGKATPQKMETIHPETRKRSLYTKNTAENTTDIKGNENEKLNSTSKNELMVLPENLNLEAYEIWCKYKGKSYSGHGKKLSINLLVKFSYEVQMQMVENSIMNNYKGLFEIKQQGTKTFYQKTQEQKQQTQQQNLSMIGRVLELQQQGVM